MSRFRRFEIVDHSPSCFTRETSIVNPFKHLMPSPFHPSLYCVDDGFDHVLDVLNYTSSSPLLANEFEAFTDLSLRENPFHSPINRLLGMGLGTELYLQSLGDRVSDLELGLHRLGREKRGVERKYTWTAEIKGPEKFGVNRKYKLTAEKSGWENNYKWTAEIKGKGGGGCVPLERTYTVKVHNGGGRVESEKDKNKKCEKVKGRGKLVGSAGRIVEIEEPDDHGVLVLRQVFARRLEKSKVKRSVLSPLDAATQIQINFRAYLIRRSQALRALRELAVAKTKLKELRALFNNFSYRHRLTRDAEERQRFSEKSFVLLLTVDAIEGADIMVRAVKEAMVNELGAMLDVVDPHPHGKSVSFRRRRFDMPEALINKQLAAGVAQVVQMLDQEASSSETFEACL